MDRVQLRGRNMKLLALGAVLVALTAGYLLIVRRFNVIELPSKRHFGVTGRAEPAGEFISSRSASTPSTTPCSCVHMCRQAYRKAKALTAPRIAI
jgi:hypothetical protein